MHGDVWEFKETSGVWLRHDTCEGGLFSPRSGHAAVPLDSSVLLFGGHDPRGSKIHDDLLMLHVPCGGGSGDATGATGDQPQMPPLHWKAVAATGTAASARREFQLSTVRFRGGNVPAGAVGAGRERQATRLSN